MPTITYTEKLATTRCWCGIALAVPANLLDNAVNHGQQLYCPLGHTFGWNETEADRQRKKAQRLEADLARERALRDQAEAEAEHERKVAQGYKGVAAKAKKRAAKGVCPAPGCKRSFVDVARHIATCHPDLTTSEAVTT